MLDRLVSIVAPPLCTGCGADAGRAGPLCGACRAELARISLAARAVVVAGVPVWSAFAYEGPAGALVRGLKFAGRTRLAGVMAAQIAANAPPVLFDAALVPVPLHRARQRRRGFNQARLLAEALAARTGAQVADCLRRDGARAPQSLRGRAARVGALAGAIRVEPGTSPPPRALLVDDVVTTGATLAACRAALWDAGCRDIAAVTYARTRGR